jgi:hypothetical protein
MPLRNAVAANASSRAAEALEFRGPVMVAILV